MFTVFTNLKNKGFTLLELTAVMLISAVITGGAIFTLNTIVQDSQEYTHIRNAQQIAEAAKLKLVKGNLPLTLGDTLTFTLKELLETGDLENLFDPSVETEEMPYHEQKSIVVIENKVLRGNLETKLQYYIRLVNNEGTHIYIDQTDMENTERITTRRLRAMHVKLPRKNR